MDFSERSERSDHAPRVNSRHSVREQRASGVISEGASEQLFKRQSHQTDRRSCSVNSSLLLSNSVEHDVFDRSYIVALVEDLQWAFSELGHQVPVAQAEDWAIFLHDSLTRESQGYHGIQHVFEICAGVSPIQFVAAVVRDVICFYSTSSSLGNPRQEELLRGVLVPGTLELATDLTDPRLCVVAHIFGHEPGTDLSAYQGLHQELDVFLSTMLASQLFEKTLPLPKLAKLATCLEATIPFRKPNDQGQTPIDHLFDRLVSCNERYELGLTESEMIDTVQQAADLHNRGVGNMVSDCITNGSRSLKPYSTFFVGLPNSLTLSFSEYRLATTWPSFSITPGVFFQNDTPHSDAMLSTP